MAKTYDKKCEMCGERFVAKVHNKRFCSKKCWRESCKDKIYARRKAWRKKNLERERNRWQEYAKQKELENPNWNRERAKLFRIRHPQQSAINHDREYFDGNKLPVMERDNFTCKICGFVGSGYIERRLAVHHIDGCRTNNNVNNLVTLCDPCHRKLTSYQIFKRFLREPGVNRKLLEELAEKAQ